MNSVLRMLSAWGLVSGAACSPIEWVHSVSKTAMLLSDGGLDAARQSDVCVALGKADACDVCAALGWYDDSSCDAFCSSYDSACTRLDPTLIGHWRLDEESGRTAVDDSSSRNDGTIAGAPTPTTGRFGRALEFHGPGALLAANDRVVVGDPANESLDFGTTSFSYGLWVRVNAPATVFDIPFTKGGGSPQDTGFNFELGAGSWKACVSDGDESLCGAFGSAPILGRWVHLMAVADRRAQTLQLYIDGNPISPPTALSSTFGSVSSNTEACIGSTARGLHAFRGLIDDVRLYNRALGATEVFQLQK